MKTPPEHKFQPGDFIMDRNFRECCGIILRQVFAGGKNKWLWYEIKNTNNEIECTSERQVKTCHIYDEENNLNFVVGYDENGNVSFTTAPTALIEKFRPELLTPLN